MRKLFGLMLMGAMALVLAGCGGDAHNHNSTGGHDHDHGKDGHGDEHGETHELGEKELKDGYHVHVALVGDMHDKGEGIFEVKVMKDDKPAKGATVTAWITHAGKSDPPRAVGEWSEAEGYYDCHVIKDKELPEGAKLHVRVLHEKTDQTATFDLPHDEH